MYDFTAQYEPGEDGLASSGFGVGNQIAFACAFPQDGGAPFDLATGRLSVPLSAH